MLEVSVVIPTLRRYRQIGRVLGALERQELDREAFEVIVASDAKEDAAAKLTAAIGERPIEVRQVRGEVPGASGTRNRGWRAARAPLILFLDDDILPSPALLAEHVSWHQRHPENEVGVLGHVSWSPELRMTPFMRWLDQGLQFGFGSIEGIEAGWSHLYTANVSLKRAMLERIEGFDEQRFPFGYEDMDLSKRLEPFGFRLLYNRAAHAEHLHAVTLDEWRGTVARIAPAERRFVATYPDAQPFYRNVLTRRSAVPWWWRRLAWLAHVVPKTVPWLGPRVWAGAVASYRRALAPSFLAAWERSGDAGSERAAAAGDAGS